MLPGTNDKRRRTHTAFATSHLLCDFSLGVSMWQAFGQTGEADARPASWVAVFATPFRREVSRVTYL